jgi:hypothetical protein
MNFDDYFIKEDPLSPEMFSNVIFSIDDFVVVQLQCRKNPAYYVGKIICWKQEDGCWEIECMRRHRTSTNAFLFPNIPDVALYSMKDVLVRLSPPKVVRSVHHFLEDEMACFVKHIH